MIESNAPQLSKKSRKPFFGYFVVLALILVCFCPVSFGMSCAGIFYSSLAEHFSVGTGMLSYYSSLLQLAALVFLPIFGRLFGTLDARKLVCGATLIVAVDFFLLAHVVSLWMFYACSFIMGIGMAILLFLAPSTLVNRWFSKRAGFFTGIVMAFTGVGGVVWSSVGGVVINSMGWSAAYTVFAVISIVIVPVCWLCIASHPEDKGLVPFGAKSSSHTGSTHAAHASSLPGTARSSVFRTPAFVFIFLLSALLNMAMYAYFIIPSYISSLEIGAALPLLGATAASAAMAGQTVAKIVLGFVGDRRPVIATCIALACGIVGVSLLLVFPVSTVAIFAGACLFGIQYGIAFVMMPIFTRRAFGSSNYANTYARVSMAASISSVIAGLAGGTIVDSGGGFALVFAIVLGISALAIIITIAVGRAIAGQVAKGTLAVQPAGMPSLSEFMPSHAQVSPFVRLPEHAPVEPVRIAGENAPLGKAELDLLSRKLRAVVDAYDAGGDAQVVAKSGVSLAAFIPSRLDAFVRVDGHEPAAAPSAYGEQHVTGESLDLLARKLRSVIDTYDATGDASVITESDINLAMFMPTQLDSFMQVGEQETTIPDAMEDEAVVSTTTQSLLGRKLRGVIDALDRNDSAEFEEDVRFVYGS